MTNKKDPPARRGKQTPGPEADMDRVLKSLDRQKNAADRLYASYDYEPAVEIYTQALAELAEFDAQRDKRYKAEKLKVMQ